MKTTFFFATLSLVMWLTLGLKEKQKEIDEEEVFEEILDREKRNASPQPVGIYFYFLMHVLRMLC